VLNVPRSRKSSNPFYVLLVVAGLSFAITATAYGVMAFRQARPRDAQPASATSAETATDDHPLMLWMRHHGEAALITELGLLALCTFAAIGTDDYWQRRARR
jgi:hypothetical protein